MKTEEELLANIDHGWESEEAKNHYYEELLEHAYHQSELDHERAVMVDEFEEFDRVENPFHYNLNQRDIQPIDIVEHESFCIGNAIKYLLRHGKKGGAEDLKKAVWYIKRELKRIYNGKEVD